MFRGIAKGKRPKGFERPKDYLPVPMTEHLAVMNTQFWQDLPDILQAQVLVMLDTGKRTGRRNGWKVPTGESEVLLWAGTPHVRTRVLLQIFALWTVLLLIPVFVLVELVPDVGGMIALAWAVVSVFIFVPYLSRGSREVFALTTHRAFTSCRTMFCSIQSSQASPPRPPATAPSLTLSRHRRHHHHLHLPLSTLRMATSCTAILAGGLRRRGHRGAQAAHRPHRLLPSAVRPLQRRLPRHPLAGSAL
eukprot:Transcript_26389.p2 GENE.Transcript_26389~~Transcript_26389.p2  ORF type:complete len:248 (+),score=56.53 Transcript_26389:86-829(+)